MGGWRLFGMAAAGIAAVALGVLFALGLRVDPGAPLPPLAPLKAKAAAYDALIRRDGFGVPHIFGPRDADVAFGLGYAQSEDDWTTLQEVVVATRGTLAAHRGRDAAITDYLVHLLRVWPATRAGYRELPAHIRAIAQAYADGVNLWAAENSGAVWPGVLPVTGEDVIAGFVFKTPLFYGLDDTFRELFEETRARDISLGPDSAFLWTPAPTHPIGSNAIAIGPSRSADGHTRLLINSHQPFSGPVAWYEARLKSEEGLDMAGGVFPGSPVILHGHSRNLGWANTVNRPDLVDVYVLETNPENETQYRFDGAWRDMEVASATIRVKLFGPLYWDAVRPVKYSVHGPVVETGHGVYAVRYAGMGETRQLVQYHALNRARNFDEWMAAMRLQALPSINYVYADRAGNIAYIYNAQMPVRASGWDWESYLPGDDPRLVWTDYHALDDLPMVINPESGFVINANNTPFEASAERDDPKPEQFPPEMGIETRMTNRALRALELFRSDSSVTADEFLAYKFDKTYSARSELAELIAFWLNQDFGEDDDLVRAQAMLRAFDMTADKLDSQAALAILAGEPIIWARIQGLPVPDAVESLMKAVAHLKEHWGRMDVAWGEVNRLRRGRYDLALGGGPDLLRAVYARTQDEDGRLVATGGDTLVYVVDWAADGTMKSESIHQFGAATQDDSSPHYDDQAPLYAEERFKAVQWDEEALARQVTRSYRPGRTAEQRD